MLKKIWNDPVWSKVIATAIIFIGTIIYSFVMSMLEELSFRKTLLMTLQNYWIEIFVILVVALGVLLIWKEKKRLAGIITLILTMFIFLVGRGVFSCDSCPNIDKMIMRVDSAFVEGLYDIAISIINEAPACAKQDTMVLIKLKQAELCLSLKSTADDFFKNRKYKQAKIEYQKILDPSLNPKDTYAEKQIVECEIKETEERMNTAKDKNYKGVGQMNLGNIIKAIEYYDEAINLYPKDEYYFNRAIANISKGDYFAAINDAKEAIRRNENAGGNYRVLGDAYCRLGKFPDAIENYEKAIDCYKKRNEDVPFIDGISPTPTYVSVSTLIERINIRIKYANERKCYF